MCILLYCLFSLLAFFIGIQIWLPEIKLLSKRYNYKIGVAQVITYVCSILAITCVVHDLIVADKFFAILSFLVAIIYAALTEWFLAKIGSQYDLLNWGIRCCLFSLFGLMLITNNLIFITPFLIIGVYLRNCPMGVVSGKKLFISSYLHKKIILDFNYMHAGVQIDLPLFSSAGNTTQVKLMHKYNVLDYIKDRQDVTKDIQSLIDMVGLNGGGIIYFPKGKYHFRSVDRFSFLKINHSNIILDGETSKNGFPLAELVCHNNTLDGRKNPWLSPFFITTGENLQMSNIFWGLQFKKKKNIVTQSGSLADPGSDGTMLTPDYSTDIIADSRQGSNIIVVKDASKLSKYILIGLYNTTEDGNLIKDILGVKSLRPEWKTPLRAGSEVAPSYQWLVEVKSADPSTGKVILSQPLWRDILTVYKPEVYNLEMLENIQIKNLHINSKWNGLFRHHGFPLYYSVRQSQEMDYGWNAINLKRVAHGGLDNVVISNFTNPIYVMDSRNLNIENIEINGYDGHQGIKIYEHACDNLFRNITFKNHFADMLGGEGNAYGNVFSNISYLNASFKPVDFDFHGFSEGPMSPPANNLFENVIGFRYIKSAAALYNLPGCAQNNIWWNIFGEGEIVGSPLFICLPYVKKSVFKEYLSSISRAIIRALQTKDFSKTSFINSYLSRKKEFAISSMPLEKHQELYHNIYLYGYKTTAKVNEQDDIHVYGSDILLEPKSIFEYHKSLL